MAGDGKLRLDGDKLVKNYPTYDRLPPALEKHFAALNAPIKKRNEEIEKWNKAHPEAPKKTEALNTPCCFQVSHALNLIGGTHRVDAKSHRRPNAKIEGNYYLGAVDELEKYLNQKYGDAEVVKTKQRSTQATMTAYLKGRQGILAFREGWAGAHTEIWDRTRVLQNGAPIGNERTGSALVNPTWMWGRPQIYFWEILPEKRAFVAPNWLLGWWDVTDISSRYYYYFYGDGTVVYTKTPPGMPYCPSPVHSNAGEFSMEDMRVRVTWSDDDYPAELFAYPPATRITTMVGVYEGVATLPFTAVKRF